MQCAVYVRDRVMASMYFHHSLALPSCCIGLVVGATKGACLIRYLKSARRLRRRLMLWYCCEFITNEMFRSSTRAETCACVRCVYASLRANAYCVFRISYFVYACVCACMYVACAFTYANCRQIDTQACEHASRQADKQTGRQVDKTGMQA